MQVIEWDGFKISKPGIYKNVPMAQYHGDICVGPSVSSGPLRTIREKSLAHCFKDSYLNPDREPKDDTDYFAIGKAAHHLVAGSGGFGDEFVVRPDKWDSWRTKDAKAWRAQQWLDKKTVLTPNDVDTITHFANSLSGHATVRAGILSGLVEHSIFWQDPVTGMWLKSRPDFLPVDSDMIVDLKTIAQADGHSCRKAITDHRYHQQLALIHDGIKATTGREMTDHVLVFIEKAAPYCINIKPLGPSSILAGQLENRFAINRFATAVQTGEWPGYDDDEVPCDLMDYAMKRIDYEVENGLLPALDEGPAPVEAAEAI